MAKRIITGIFMAVGIIVALYLRTISVYIFDGLLFLMSIVSSMELFKILKTPDKQPMIPPIILFYIAFIIFYFAFNIVGYFYAFALGTLVALNIHVHTKKS